MMADLMQQLTLTQGRIFGRPVTFIGPTTDPAQAVVMGTGDTPAKADQAFCENLMEAIKKGEVVILRDAPK
jgi:hypothetical protein